jgi:chaperonin GroEL
MCAHLRVPRSANAVKVTLGPKGRNVVLEKLRRSPPSPRTASPVAKEIELEDKLENMGAQMVKEVASKTSDNAGDGTTTATVLAQAIVREGMKLRRRRAQPDGPQARHRQGRGRTGRTAQEDVSKPDHDEQGDRPGRHDLRQRRRVDRRTIIADAMEKVGKEGVITVERPSR